jgi:hypothetical protein
MQKSAILKLWEQRWLNGRATRENNWKSKDPWFDTVLPDGIFLKNNLGNLGGPCNDVCIFCGHLVYFTYSHLVYFIDSWYILW